MRFSFFDELNICTISVPFLLGNRASRVIHTADPTMMSKPSKNWVLSSFPLHPKSTPAFSTVWFSPWRIQVASHCSRGSEVPMASQCSWGSGIQMASHCSWGSGVPMASHCSWGSGIQMASHCSRGSGSQMASVSLQQRIRWPDGLSLQQRIHWPGGLWLQQKIWLPDGLSQQQRIRWPGGLWLQQSPTEGPSVPNTVQTPLYNAICPSLHTPFPHFMPVLHTQYTFHSTFKLGKEIKKCKSACNNVHANEPIPCTFYLCVEKIQDPP